MFIREKFPCGGIIMHDKRKRIKRTLALLAAFCMLLLQMGMPVYADDAIEVSTPAEFNAVVNDLNANGGSKTIRLTADVALTNQNPQIKKGELTILGEGHTLTASLSVLENGKLNLGMDGYDKTLDIPPGRSDLCVVNTDGNGVLNIYDGVTIRDCTRAGQAGGITSFGNSVINMYGGTITNCNSHAVAGAIYLDGHSVFNMYDGTISNCEGPIGGAVGLSGGSPIGPATAGPVSFNMYGGTIDSCTSNYYGGGAVCCAYSYYPVTFNMYGGTISNCKAKGTGTYNYGGGAVYILSLSDFTLHMEGGTITGCDSTASRYGYGGAVMIYTSGSASDIKFTGGTITKNSGNYGGGLFIWGGGASIADGFGLHNNTAAYAGDDIYNNGQAVTLGTADTSATLESTGQKITGWYEDAEERWSCSLPPQDSDHLVLFEHTGEQYSEEYGLKAAHGVPEFTVTWKNYDGTVLETDQNVPYGTMPSYDGATPERPDDDEHTYSFDKWDPELSEVTEDVTYTAVFSEDAREYTVTYYYSGSVPSNAPAVPQQKTYAFGSTVNVAAEPHLDGYTFSGWSRTGSFSMPASNVVISGSWTKDETDPGNTPSPIVTPAAGNPGGPAGTVTPDETEPEEVIPDEPTPESTPEEIPEQDPPLVEGTWALLNLIMAAVTAIGAVVALFRKKEDDEDDYTDGPDGSGKKMTAAKIIGAVAGVAAPVTFILTEDMTRVMTMVDKYTPVMAVLLAVQIVAAVINRQASKGKDDGGNVYDAAS